MLRVLDLRMELSPEEWAATMGNRLDPTVLTVGQKRQVRRELDDLVIVALPDREAARKTCKELVGIIDDALGLPELSGGRRDRSPSQLLCDELASKANPEYRKRGILDVVRGFPHGNPLSADPRSASREDETIDIELFEGGGVGDYLGVDLEIAEHSPFTMRPLTPIVDDVYPQGHGRDRDSRLLEHWARGAPPHHLYPWLW